MFGQKYGKVGKVYGIFTISKNAGKACFFRRKTVKITLFTALFS